MSTVQLNTSDAAELAEMLTFLDDWLANDPHVLSASLEKFVGGSGYTTGTLRTDLARFAFLLVGEGAARLFGGDES
jgi:hypothetical protein